MAFNTMILCACLIFIHYGTNFVSSDSNNITITVAVLNERSAVLDFPSQLNRSIGVIEHAINRTQELLKYEVALNFIIRNVDTPFCTDMSWGALVAQLYHKEGINAIIGPGCTNAVQTVSRLASSWNLPHITYAGTGASSGNKTEFRMLSRLSYNTNSFAHFYIEVFKAFDWVDIANIYDASSYRMMGPGISLQALFLQQNIRSYALPFQAKAKDLEAELLRVLTKAKQVSRVFLVSCHGDVFRKMVLQAQTLGMELGEYVFIVYNFLPGDPVIGDFSWKRGDNFDVEAKRAYDAVMMIRPRRPVTEEFFEFEKVAMKRASVVYGYVWPEGAELNVFNIGHYDSVLLYAYAVKETLGAGEDPRDGENVVKRMRNRTFPGIGGLVYINENGDRDADFTLMDEDPVTGGWRVAAQYLGYTHTFELFPIHWPNEGGPPPNMPPCGYSGELCISYSLPTYAIVAIVLGSLIGLVVLAGGLAYRRMRLEAEIFSQWWRIKWDEISTRTVASTLSSGSFRDETSFSIATCTAAFQTIGIYKGTCVHIQKPSLKSLTIDRILLLELKQMRDITCQNLTRLIGICPEAPNICIITEYCSRGRLQDILQNESMQLDWEFRISLINDIVQGMHFIHNSPIQVHGRLTSSRCMIDSRFVLKITGFGPKCIIDSVDNKAENEHYPNTSELLWVAPEVLRRTPPRMATQSGDVYSFGIILYEMCTRNEPYVTEPWYQSLDDTISQIRRKCSKPRRPSFGDSSSFPEVHRLAVRCWKEDPEARPNFTAIRRTVKSWRNGRGQEDNVLDALLHRMEQYANNLENLVEERTRAFIEEKKRSEELLYQVLPKSVADQLRSGQTVVPEAYDCVTIYFSDIVGFTTISAASSPLQVVDLLNDVYTCFDAVIDHFEVYKVETIGDAYMVVSGLPVRNGTEHARQIARMSLSLLTHVQQFTIRHQPENPLRARIGLHSGPVCAGVVGRKMPRYCLFGDTVNTASRMESTGEAMKIHISSSTKQLLDRYDCFWIEERGTITVKGKGLMSTYWLIEEQMTGRLLPD